MVARPLDHTLPAACSRLHARLPCGSPAFPGMTPANPFVFLSFSSDTIATCRTCPTTAHRGKHGALAKQPSKCGTVRFPARESMLRAGATSSYSLRGTQGKSPLPKMR